jgi:hypothetical protein
VRITYQTGSIGYGELVEYFYRTHDPTTVDRQGPDRGSQYRSAIFFHTPEQEQVARQVTKEVQEKYLPGKPIVTQIEAAGKWWTAEDYHQQYCELICLSKDDILGCGMRWGFDWCTEEALGQANRRRGRRGQACGPLAVGESAGSPMTWGNIVSRRTGMAESATRILTCFPADQNRPGHPAAERKERC